MTDSSAAGEPLAVGRCPWCSAPLDDVGVATCPSCGASLHEQLEGDLPGLTQVDAMALATQRRARGGGMRALIGLTDEDTEGSPARLVPEPPSEAVRREMMRLRIDALEAEIEAQTAALEAARAAAAAGGPPPPEPPAQPDEEPAPPDTPA
ncbi:MAG TPA: hypothetical protein VK831_03005 [Candidatus Deferrimicrobiaceae bacterium]|nr:hypothetical protein [Candidatus Deferrimicrobiaceae bacterium]